jgi:ERCC4-type nuclease
MILVDVTESASNRASDRLIDLRRCITPPSLVQPEKLDFGDVAFSGNGPNGPALVGVEIKSPGDCVQCIDTGRFAGHQLPGLVDTYHHVWLLVEGEYRPGEGGVLQTRRYDKREKKWGWHDARYGRSQSRTYASFSQWLTTMEIGGGIRIGRVASRPEAAAWIASLYWWWNKPWAQHKSLRVISQPERGKYAQLNTIAKMAAMIRGVGYEKAIEAGSHFPTPADMVNAEVGEWMKLKGVGKKTAEDIYRTLRSKGGRG